MGMRQLTTKVGTAVVAVSAWVGYPFLLPIASQPFCCQYINGVLFKTEMAPEVYLKQKWAWKFI